MLLSLTLVSLPISWQVCGGGGGDAINPALWEIESQNLKHWWDIKMGREKLGVGRESNQKAILLQRGTNLSSGILTLPTSKE